MRVPGWIHLITALLASCSDLRAAEELPSWTDHARRFTGESARVRENAIKALKTDPKLELKLKAAYGTNDHFLALDVISVLRLRSLLPFLKEASLRDRTGFSYHVMNSLMTKKDYETYRQLYLDRLQNPKSSPAAKMAILDALPRLNAELSVTRLQELMRDPSPEVRSSVLAFARHETLRERRTEYLELLKPAIADDAFQIRIQALYFVTELPKNVRDSQAPLVAQVLGQCADDPVTAVKNLCGDLRK